MGQRKKRPVLFAPSVFLVYKPPGPSSFAVVSHFKKHLPSGYGKIGHFGTLDPFAEGLLMIGIAGAQKLNDFVHAYLPKTYRARGLVGIKTNTGDHLGEILEQKTPKLYENYLQQWREKAKSFEGEYWQTPPAFSAVKLDGLALYEYARAGVMIEKPAVKREVFRFEIEQIEINAEGQMLVDLVATVSSGTYIRSLFEDLCKTYDEYGHLLTLERSAVGHLQSKQALRVEQWPNREGGAFEMQKNSLRLDQVLPLHQYILSAEQARKFAQGITLRTEDLTQKSFAEHCASGLFWILNEDQRLLGLAHEEEGLLKINFNLAVEVA